MMTRSTRSTRSTRGRVLAALLAVGALAATSCRVAPDDLAVTVVADGLDRPWDLGFLPDGTMVVTERSGTVRALSSSGSMALASPSDVASGGEGGMLGLAVDPDFATNRYLYTCFNSTLSGALDVRVVRWRVDEAVTTLTERTDIVTGLPARSTGRHSGCRPRFGPDGNLWIATGDAAMSTVPQDPTSLGGKVLRVTRDGAGAPGNPGGALDPRIYTYGHRNVQGLAFRPSDGQAFSIEHGTDRDDEINRLEPGANCGWHPYRPSNPALYDETQPMTDLEEFPDAVEAIWSSGFPTIAPSGGTFLSGPAWKGWDGTLAVAVLKDQHLHVVAVGPNGQSTNQEWVAVTDRGRLRSAVQGPDGALYLATDAGASANPAGRILRVEPIELPDA